LVAEGVLLESAGLKNVEVAESATDPSSTLSTKSGALAAGNTMVLAGLVFRLRRAKEQSQMTKEKVIMLIEAKIQPERRAKLVEAVRQYLPLVRAEPGVEAFYLTVRKDDPNTFVFYEIYRSQAAQDFHLQQDFTNKFLATLKSAQVGERVRTNLVELDAEAQAHSA
jgi:quinol monooxygenase YgiN